MSRRILSILLGVMIAFTIITPFSVLAEGNTPTITVASVSDTAGATISIDVSIKNNPGILGATLKLTYDDGLTLIDVDSGEAFSALVMTEPGKLVSPCNFSWDGESTTAEDDGTILTLQFKINDSAVAGEEFEIKLESNGIQDVDVHDVDVKIENGNVTVVDYLPGDLNGDNKVNSGDIILLRRHVAGGYEQTINELACDVNNDGKKNSGDIILVRRYVAGGYDVVLKPSGPQCSHEMTETPYNAPDCTEAGNIRYWSCSKCKKLFNDVNGTTVISQNSTIISATGHTVVIDPAVEATYNSTGLTEGKHCSACGEVIVAQTIIPKLEKDEYAITYHIHNNDNYLESLVIDNPNPASYSKEDGLVLQDLIVKGYNFVGWFTAQTGGTQVTEIPVGATGTRVLYARWEKAEYTVQFDSDMSPQASFTYTTGQEMTLPKPVLDKYTFVGWSDKAGNMWDTIPAGTAQDLILYANWSSNRNKAVAKGTLEDPIICEDSKSGLILFTYEIGEIQNVPLFTTLNLQCANGIITTVSKTETEEISSTQATTIAQTISNATTNSASWTLENNWNNTTEVSQTYLDQTGQTREEAESLAKSESGTYNLSSSNGGSGSFTDTSTGAYSLSMNKGHSNTSTTESGQNFDLSVDAKFSSETSIGASIPIEIVNLDVGQKYGFEIGAGVDYGNYAKHTNTGTSSWSADESISRENSRTLTAEKNWNTSEGYSNSKSTSKNSTVANAVSKLISQEYGYGSSYAEGGSNSESQALATTDSKSDEYSSTITYHTSKITSTTKEFQSTGETIGSYRMVMAGTVHVFAVVGYDVAERTYFVYTYNVLDDKTEEYLDYSFDGTFNDYETSIIPFEIPHFVNDYVNTRIASTVGLQIDPDTGTIVNYIPDSDNPDTIVIIPSYISVDNGDETYTSVKVTGISEGLFKNNTDIKGVKLGNFITEIPDSAFEGCSSLEYVITPGVTKIGDNAFKGCTSLGEFTIPVDVTEVGANAFSGVTRINASASNADVAEAVASSGAKNIVLDISNSNMSNTALDVGEITSFELQGKNKSYSGLSVKSDATTTVINGVTFADCTNIPMELSSENVTLNRVSATTQGLALVMSSDSTNVKLNQNITLTSGLGKAVLCKDVSLSSLSASVVGKMTLSGDMLVAGDTVSGEKLITFNSGELKYITDDEFESYRSSCTVTFDANGGTLDTTSKTVAFNAAIGDMPTPTYGDYTFLGWYTEKNGGTRITEDTVVTSTAGITAYAKWNNWDGTSTEPAYNSATKTYTVTNGNELAWVSDVTNEVITSGTNFPDNISFSGYTIQLANDIYLNDTTDWENWDTTAPENEWKPIGDNEEIVFLGYFKGNNYCISGMYVKNRSLFRYSNGEIENIKMYNSHIYTPESDTPKGAGIVYENGENGIVRGCENHSALFARAGIVYWNYGFVTNCSNYGDITCNSDAGGIVCSSSRKGTITYCANLGDISVSAPTSYTYVGGILGSMYAERISYCYNQGDIYVEGEAKNVCGIGDATEEISYCYNSGSITVDTTGVDISPEIAGIGDQADSLHDCHNSGSIICYTDSSNSVIGGIISGLNGDGAIVARCYNIGTIRTSNGYAGSIAGSLYGDDVKWSHKEDYYVRYCYSNKTPLYNLTGDGNYYRNISNVTQLSSSSLKNLSNLTSFSSSVWATDSSINNGYPYLVELKDTY